MHERTAGSEGVVRPLTRKSAAAHNDQGWSTGTFWCLAVVLTVPILLCGVATVGCSCSHNLQAALSTTSGFDTQLHVLEPAQQQVLDMGSTQPPRLVRPLVVLFGDSLTQYSFDPEGGWGAALAHYLQRRADVLNRGHSGYNSRWGLKVFEQVLQQLRGQEVLLLTLWLGANDAAIPGRSAERQHVPAAEYRSNLEAMVQAARKAGVSNIVLLTPPPVHNEGRIKHQQQKMGISTPVEPDRTLEYTQQYAAVVLDLGRQLQLPVVDLFHKLQQLPGWQTQLLKDGLHFTPAGSTAVWQQLQEVLAAQLPHINPEQLAAQFPIWDQIDTTNLEQYWRDTLQEMQGPAES